MASAAGSQGPAPLPPGPGCPRAVMHLDMDCFFAAVAEVESPIFKGKPLVSACTGRHPASRLVLETAASCPPITLQLLGGCCLPCLLQAVCHSASATGTGEVSTANYEARKYGVRSGMMIRWEGGGWGWGGRVGCRCWTSYWHYITVLHSQAPHLLRVQASHGPVPPAHRGALLV
jgi:hypothetical protein